MAYEIEKPCPNCHSCNWQVVEQNDEATHKNRFGVVLEWHTTLLAECQSRVEFDNAPGEWGPCGYKLKVEFDEALEYEPEEN